MTNKKGMPGRPLVLMMRVTEVEGNDEDGYFVRCEGEKLDSTLTYKTFQKVPKVGSAFRIKFNYQGGSVFWED